MQKDKLISQTVHLASDHAGFKLKTYLADWLKGEGLEVIDHGTDSPQSCDYPVFAKKLALAVKDSGQPGILVCGSGIGVSMVANRFPGVRAALCTHEFHAKGSRAHNNANVICLGERVTAPGLASILVEIFLTEPFEGGRHAKRVDMIDI